MREEEGQLLLANLMTCLRSCQDFVAGVSKADYSQPVAALGGASIGAHIRHLIDHVECVASMSECGCMDYDCRERGTPVEHDPQAARFALSSLLDAVAELDPSGMCRQISVLQGAGPTWQGLPVQSTVGREVLFAMSHCVHHFALISMLGHALEIPIPEGFGVMPSTDRHLRRASA